jgi:succinoglycan biosynthesis transport protein ExoP
MTPALRDEFQLSGPPEFDAPAAPKFQWHKFLRFLKKFWWLPVVTLSLCFGGALIYVRFMPPSYSSQASMWEQVKLRLPEGPLFSEDMENFLGTQSDVMQSSRLRNMVLSRLTSEGVKIPLDKNGQPLWVNVSLSQNAKSDVLVLEATGSDAAYTKAYLDTLMDAYLELKMNVRKVVSGDTLSSITEQVQKTERDLKTQQEILTTFERTNNLTILQEEATTAGDYLMRKQTELSDLELQDRLLQAVLQSGNTADLSTNGNSSALLLSLAGSDSASGLTSAYAASLQELETLKNQREKLSQNLRPKHPKMVKLDEDIKSKQKVLDLYMRQNHEQFAEQQQTLQLKMTNIASAIKEWQRKVVAANDLIAQANQLQSNVQQIQGVYDRLMLLIQNVDISRNIDQETLAILEPASDAQRSYAKETGTLHKSVFLGLGLGLGLILLITLRDDRFSSVVEVTEKLGDSVVGQVPEVPQMDGKAPLLLAEGKNQYMLAESYRNLRSALTFMAVEGARPKVVLITSALPSEGKSTVATNLAQALALGGARVVLVDCDLRRGVIHARMGLQREPGLSEILHESAGLEVIQTSSITNLSFISSGKPSDNSGDLFLGQAFDRLLARLREQFDYVLMDSSPVLATDDATTLAPKADGTLFIVRGNFTGARQVREAINLLQQRQAKILGVVFNRANSSAKSYHYYNYAEYNPVNDK